MGVKRVDLGEVLNMDAREVAHLHAAERVLAPRLLIMVAAFIMINYIDRTNLALASVELTAALGLTPATYGLGASLFFVSYFLLQVPSQLIAAYVPRQNLWLAGLLFLWGAVATCMAAMRDIPQFLALRVLLGVFEAGALPGMWSYLSHFYCKERIAVPLAVMMGSLTFSQALGPLLAAGLLSMHGVSSLEGWQWLFIVEGLLAVALSFAWILMPHDLESVKALSPEQLAAVHSSLARSHRPVKGGNQLQIFWKALSNPAVLTLCAVKFSRDVAFYGVTYWAPLIVKSMLGFSAFGPAHEGGASGGGGGGGGHGMAVGGASIKVVLLIAVPFAAAAGVQFVNAWHAQRTNERRYHLAATWGFGALCLFALPSALSNFYAGFAVIVCACIGVFGAEGIMVAHFLSLQGGEKGIGIAIVNSAGALGGFVGPMLMGALKQKTGNYGSATYVLAAFLLNAAVMIACFNPAWADKWMHRASGAGGGGGGAKGGAAAGAAAPIVGAVTGGALVAAGGKALDESEEEGAGSDDADVIVHDV